MNYRYKSGDRLLSRYEVQHGVGVGGFGEVYYAVSDAGKDVALKSVQRNLEVEIRGVSHCLNLKHQNLVALHDICTDENQQPWIVMEYVSGPNLREVLKNSPNGLPLAEVERWSLGILRGVIHLHQAGIVHRDLKPENIFDDQGVIKVGDYGLSTLIQSGDIRQTEGVGTVHYMAPEVGRGEYGPSVDLYAIGIILYELLTGRVPFDGETKNEVMMKHLTTEPIFAGVPESFKPIVAKCLHKDRMRRYRDLGDLLEQIIYITNDPAEIIDAEFVSSDRGQDIINDVAKVASHQEDGLRPSRTRFGSESADRYSNQIPSVAIAVVAICCLVNPLLIISWTIAAILLIIPACLVWMASKRFRNGTTQIPTKGQFQYSNQGRILPHPVNSPKWKADIRDRLKERSVLKRSSDWMRSSAFVILTALLLGFILAVIPSREKTDVIRLLAPNPDYSVLLQNFCLPAESLQAAPFIWMAVVVIISAIGLLGFNQHWQTKAEHDLSDRVVQAIFGAVIGVAALSLHDYLLLSGDFAIDRNVDFRQIAEKLYNARYFPTRLAFVAHFSLLFFFVRWYRVCDPIRNTKLSLWAIMVVVTVEWCLQQFFPIGPPAGMLFAAVLVIVLQLAAPWIPMSQRENLLTSDNS